MRAIDSAKDVDGFHPFNAGQLYLGRPTLVPATPRRRDGAARRVRVELEGARAVVVGRSDDRRQADRAAARSRRTRP